VISFRQAFHEKLFRSLRKFVMKLLGLRLNTENLILNVSFAFITFSTHALVAWIELFMKIFPIKVIWWRTLGSSSKDVILIYEKNRIKRPFVCRFNCQWEIMGQRCVFWMWHEILWGLNAESIRNCVTNVLNVPERQRSHFVAHDFMWKK
jgi:hypothetical protein